MAALAFVFQRCRKQPRWHAWAAPADDQTAVLIALEVIQADRRAAGFQLRDAFLRGAKAMRCFVFDDTLTVDEQPRAVVRVERELVFAVLRHLQNAGKHKAEIGITRSRRQVEQRNVQSAHRLGLDDVELGNAGPMVAIKAKLKIVQVRGLSLDSRRMLVSRFEPGFDRRQFSLHAVALPL